MQLLIQLLMSKQNLLGANFCVRNMKLVRDIQVKDTNISYIATLFKVSFIEDAGLSRVQFRQETL
jgi:hypothetical protein